MGIDIKIGNYLLSFVVDFDLGVDASSVRSNTGTSFSSRTISCDCLTNIP